MKRENILISEDYTKKRVAVVKFTAPGDIPVFDCSIHFGKEGNDVTMQNCIIKDNLIVKCSPDDTYDFETGALIALMKMCGVEKVVRACNEAFSYETCKYAIPSNNHTEWLYKIPTKREVMWKNIKNFKGDSCIEVNRADIIDFLKELEEEMPEVHWVSGRKPTDIPYHMFNYKYTHEYDKVYFFIDDRYITYDFDKQTSRTNVQYVNYLSPMRWDLFKKGRLAVKVDFDNYKEFYEACKKELGKRPLTNFACVFTVSICKDDGFFEIFTVEDQKKTGRKIVDWEDVR